MRLLPIILLLAVIAGCPRDPGAPQADADLPMWSYPWELRQLEQQAIREAQAPVGEPVELLDAVRPAFAGEDTFDPEYLSGAWLQSAGSSPARVELPSLSQMDIIEFAPNNKLVYHFISEQDIRSDPGSWEKSGPGLIKWQMDGQEPTTLNIEFHGPDFFYFWSDVGQRGYWFVRIPEAAVAGIMANRFDTTFGELHLANVVGDSFEGTVSGEYERLITGVYKYGILLIRWDEPETSSSGYGALRVEADWSGFTGAWWLADFEAAPFGGEWNGTAAGRPATPEPAGDTP